MIRSIKSMVLGSVGVALLAMPVAHAAVSVMGTGLAQSCYQAAEYGGSPRDGIRSCTMALEETAMSGTDKAATLVNRGILLARNDDPQGALNDYNHGLTIDSTLGEGYVDRGATEIVLKNFDAALADINKGIALHANKLEIAYYDRAIVDEAVGDIHSAYEDYKMAVELRPDFTLASEQLSRFKVVRKHTNGA